MQTEDALKYLIEFMRAKESKPSRPANDSGPTSYGYDVYLSNVMSKYVREEEPKSHGDPSFKFGSEDTRINDLSPEFYAAAWELCRRGIIRPGIKTRGADSTKEGTAGEGFSFTPFGKLWLQESSQDIYVPTEPERFGKLLDPFKERFGPGFHERAQQAVRCYGAHAYLACCAMCGAASESILLSIAIGKTRDEQKVLHEYRTAKGRITIESLIIGKLSKEIQTSFRGKTELLKYWRDESAHGSVSTISDNEAFTSLAMLLRFSQFSNDLWNVLIQP